MSGHLLVYVCFYFPRTNVKNWLVDDVIRLCRVRGRACEIVSPVRGRSVMWEFAGHADRLGRFPYSCHTHPSSDWSPIL